MLLMKSSKRIQKISRRRFVQSVGVTAGFAAQQAVLPVWARSGGANSVKGIQPLSGNVFDLRVSDATHKIQRQSGRAVLINGQLPAPLLRWREGDEVTLNVSNALSEDTSIHWHGLLLPFHMDGVPGVSFPGIKPGETFSYRFPLKQAGTYWYHSHSGLQEQQGHYGPIIIEPKNDDPVHYDREFVIVLSDWTFEDPHRLFAKLKKHSDYYNRAQLTAGDFLRDANRQGFKHTLSERAMWGAMRMNSTDIADVTAATYTYLINGHSPAENWQALFTPGERVRLRFINASAMSIFNVRIPELPMTVVASDGLNLQPVETDEFQIGTAETFDVVVQPQPKAYRIMAESNDRSGFAAATLTPSAELRAETPALRPRPTLTMKDMAMDHGRADHSSHQHHGVHHSNSEASNMPSAGQEHNHTRGPGVVGLAQQPSNRLHERPLGLEDAPHRVLVYTDLHSLERNPDTRSPERELELHLTSNMERYMWSFDGKKFSEVREPIVFHEGERLRLTLVNDTMMPHPIHLHGMFFELVTGVGDADFKPRKHTVVVKPGEKMAIDVSADALGDWAFHCHLLYHMHAGMMRVVSVKARA